MSFMKFFLTFCSFLQFLLFTDFVFWLFVCSPDYLKVLKATNIQICDIFCIFETRYYLPPPFQRDIYQNFLNYMLLLSYKLLKIWNYCSKWEIIGQKGQKWYVTLWLTSSIPHLSFGNTVTNPLEQGWAKCGPQAKSDPPRSYIQHTKNQRRIDR